MCVPLFLYLYLCIILIIVIAPGGLPAPSAPAENASLPDVPQPSFPAPAPSVPSVPPQQLISPTSHLNRDVSNLTGSQRSSQGGSPMSTTSAPAGQLSHSQPSNPPPANIPMNAPVVLSQSLPAPVAYNAATSTYRPPNTGLSPDEFAQALQQVRFAWGYLRAGLFIIIRHATCSLRCSLKTRSRRPSTPASACKSSRAAIPRKRHFS